MPQRFLLLDSDTAPWDAPVFHNILTSSAFDLAGWIVTPSLFEPAQALAHASWLKELTRSSVQLQLGAPRAMMAPFPPSKSPAYAPPLQTMPEPKTHSSVAFLLNIFREAPRPVTLLIAGPATNLALALVADPTIRSKLEEIWVVGGTVMASGDATPAAEARFFADPHAVSLLLAARLPLLFFPLDLSQGLEPPSGWREAWSRTLGKAWEQAFSATGTLPPLHGLAAGAYSRGVVDPALCRPAFSTLATHEGPLKGKTTVDWWKKLPEAPNGRYLAEDHPGSAALPKACQELIWTLPEIAT